MLVALAGYDDARGFRQWLEVGRHVRKGEHGFPILCPVQKTVTRVDSETGETVKGMAVVGFTSTVVFGYEQTDGDELPDRENARRFIEALPLIDVAKAWGLTVQTFNGEQARYLGFYRRSGIALGVENLATWAHELIHAADDKRGRLTHAGQHWAQEIVAELGGCILLDCMGLDRDADAGGCWDYVQRHAADAKLTPISAIQKLLKRTCDAVALVLTEYDRLQAEKVAAQTIAA